MFGERVNVLMKEVEVLTKLGYSVEETNYYSKIFKDAQEIVLSIEESVKYARMDSMDRWKDGFKQYDDGSAICAYLQVRAVDKKNESKRKIARLQEYKRAMKSFVDSMMDDINGYEVTLRRESAPFFKGDLAGMDERAGNAVLNLMDVLRFKEQILVSPFYIEPEIEKKKEAEPGSEE